MTVIAFVGEDEQPVEAEVKVKVAFPAPILVTSPSLFTAAIKLLLLDHVPFTEGDNDVVEPTQIDVDPNIDTIGLALNVTEAVGFDKQPVLEFV